MNVVSDNSCKKACLIVNTLPAGSGIVMEEFEYDLLLMCSYGEKSEGIDGLEMLKY
jgi:hypothetical protein